MKGKRYKTEEKVRILRDVGAGRSIVHICREKNISDVTYHGRRKQFGHLNLNEAKRLKELERENTELKKMLAEAMLAKKVLAFPGPIGSAPGKRSRRRRPTCSEGVREENAPHQFAKLRRLHAASGNVRVDAMNDDQVERWDD